MVEPIISFWNQLENKEISKEQVEPFLISKLGEPTNPTQQNLLTEIVKKVYSYYFTEPIQTNFTTYSLIGFTQEILEKKFKEGKSKGQSYYILKLGGESKEKLMILKENLPAKKWQQIQNLAILQQNLVFKYKKWITNKQLLDFYPLGKTSK